MGTIYTKASKEICDAMRRVMDLHHPDLIEAEATIGVVLAHAEVDDNGEIRRPALVKHGFRVLGRIKINNQADRVDGKPDATMTLDGDHWDGLESANLGRDQEALIHHELTHLVVCRYPGINGRPGEIRRDIHSRPQLKIRPHDYELTGFLSVAEHYGAASVEVQEAKRWADAHGNILFGFANEFAERLL